MSPDTKPRPSDGVESHETGVDLAGLMAVLSQHLYSTPDVAIRELVQNAHDAVTRRHLVDAEAPPAWIEVRADEQGRTLDVHDNGAGLTLDEIHACLATVGVGATRTMREQGLSEDLIGLFGLGFLSAFVVADEVVVTTTSHRTPGETWQYRSFDGFRYSVLPATPGPVGTVVRLHLSSDFADLGSPAMVRAVLDRYCRLLPLPVVVDGGGAVNLTPPWRSSDANDGSRLEFAAAFESRFEPIAALPIETPDQWLQGQLWIHGGSTYGNADNRRLSVYVRGMLLAENDVDVLPRWAGFVSGVVESARLTPTASRETLQRDAAYTEAQMVIAEALTAGLAALAARSPAAWRRVLARHGEALLGAAVTDDRLFELVADRAEIPTSHGTIPVAELRVGRRVHVSLGAERGFEEVLFHALGVPIARGGRYGVLPFLRRYADAHDLVLVEVGSDDGNAAIFEPIEVSADVQTWLDRELGGEDQAVIAARFDPATVPLVVIPDREAELKHRLDDDEIDRRAGSGMAGLARLHTEPLADRPRTRVYVNLECPSVARLVDHRASRPAAVTRGLTFLRALKVLMMASDRDRGGLVDINGALADTLAVIDGLVLEERHGPGPHHIDPPDQPNKEGS